VIEGESCQRALAAGKTMEGAKRVPRDYMQSETAESKMRKKNIANRYKKGIVDKKKTAGFATERGNMKED